MQAENKLTFGGSYIVLLPHTEVLTKTPETPSSECSKAIFSHPALDRLLLNLNEDFSQD